MYFVGLDARQSVARREFRCLQISIKPVCSLARKERSDGIAIVAHCANRVTTESLGLLSNTSHTSKRKTPRQKWEEVDFAETPHTGTSRQSVTAREACCLIIWLPLPCGSRAPPKASGFFLPPPPADDEKDTTVLVVSYSWWEEVDSNHRSRRRQIYSLMHLATLQSARILN